MPVKTCKVLMCGQSGVGKTSIVEHLLYANHIIETTLMHSTIEDIYTALIETERGVKEKIRIFDIGGLDSNHTELPKHFLSFPDGFILVYDVTNFESFKRLDKLKKDIDKNRDKKEIHIIVIGNKSELTEHRQVDFNTAVAWASKEKCKTTFLPSRKPKTTNTEN